MQRQATTKKGPHYNHLTLPLLSSKRLLPILRGVVWRHVIAALNLSVSAALVLQTILRDNPELKASMPAEERAALRYVSLYNQQDKNLSTDALVCLDVYMDVVGNDAGFTMTGSGQSYRSL